jgi:hypothetical protein
MTGDRRFLARLSVEPLAGIEPATPSLPSMVGPFGGQHGTSFRSVELQVAGLIDEREMGCCEAVCGAAAGKSLARMQIIVGLAGPGRAAMQPPTVQGCWCECRPGQRRSASTPRGRTPTARSLVWCSASIWSTPDESGLLRLDASSIQTDPVGSRWIVWRIKRMIKAIRHRIGWCVVQPPGRGANGGRSPCL